MTPLDQMLMTSLPMSSAASSLCGARMLVSNFPPEIDEAAICRLIGPFGSVQSVCLLPGQRVAIVTMFNYVEALNAVAGLNGLSINGCVLQVSIAPNNTPGVHVAPGCANPTGQLTMVPVGHGLAADTGRQMPYFLPSVGAPAAYELAPLAII